MSKIPAILLYSIFTETLYLRQVANKYKSRNMDFQTATLSIITASHFIGYRFEMLRALFVQNILFSIQKLHADNLDMCGNCITHTHSYRALIYKIHLIHNQLADLFFPDYSAFLLRNSPLNAILLPLAACQRKDILMFAGDTR